MMTMTLEHAPMMPNSSFSKSHPFLQLAWDSTSLGALKECPRKYYLAIVCGWRTRTAAVDLEFGILYHAAIERYYRARAKNLQHNAALLGAIEYALESTWDIELQRPASWCSLSPIKNRLTLVRSIVWYLDEFGQDDPLATVILANGKPAVELSFRFETFYSPVGVGAPFLLCGHLDRLCTFNDQHWVSDKKTTGHTITQQYFDQFSPDNQMSLYSFAGKIVYGIQTAGVIIDAAQIAVTFTRFQRGIVQRTDVQLEEWYEELGTWLRHAQRYATHGANLATQGADPARAWPMNDRACFRCQFRSICSKPSAVRGQWLKADFIQQAWDPLVPRT